MNVTQLSLFLENKPGRLQSALKVLAGKNINIRTLTIAEVSDFGIVRMIVTQPDEAVRALRENHFTCSTTDVLAIELDDEPGSLERALDIFGRHGLNIEYMYAFTSRQGNRAVLVFRFDDPDAAVKVLEKGGVRVLRKEDIVNM